MRHAFSVPIPGTEDAAVPDLAPPGGMCGAGATASARLPGRLFAGRVGPTGRNPADDRAGAVRPPADDPEAIRPGCARVANAVRSSTGFADKFLRFRFSL